MHQFNYKHHPAADLFPMMDSASLSELAGDIEKNGLIEPILLVAEQILDGRNRYEACRMVGVEPVFEQYEGDVSDEALLKVSISLNMKRRHLDAGQKAMIAVKILPMLEAEARQRQKDAAIRSNSLKAVLKKKSEATDEESESFLQTDETSLSVQDTPGEEMDQKHLQREKTVTLGSGEDPKKGRKAVDEVGAIVGVNGSYVSEAKRIMNKDPELAARVMAKEISITEARNIILERVKQDEKYQSLAHTEKLELMIPAKAHFLRSQLVEMLKQSEKDHPEDIEIYVKAGGTEACLSKVKKIVR